MNNKTKTNTEPPKIETELSQETNEHVQPPECHYVLCRQGILVSSYLSWSLRKAHMLCSPCNSGGGGRIITIK